MTGFVHLMVPHDRFELLSGRDSLSSYRFGTGAAEHLFCRTCGVKSFYQPRSHADSWSVNPNCLDDPPELAVEPFDGRNWEQAKARSTALVFQSNPTVTADPDWVCDSGAFGQIGARDLQRLHRHHHLALIAFAYAEFECDLIERGEQHGGARAIRHADDRIRRHSPGDVHRGSEQRRCVVLS